MHHNRRETNQTHKPDHYSCLPSTPAGVQHANFNSNLECPEELKAKYLEKYDRTIFLVLKYIFPLVVIQIKT